MTAADAWLIAEYKRRYRAKRAVPADERDESWRPFAACAGEPRDWWFAPATRDEHDQAAAICATCPVVDACTEYGARWREYGRWGRWVYLDERDMKTLRRRAAALGATCDACPFATHGLCRGSGVSCEARGLLEREVVGLEADVAGFEVEWERLEA